MHDNVSYFNRLFCTQCLLFLHDQTKMRCRFHFAELLSFVDAPLAGSKAACTTLANILLKAHILNVSDKEKSLGCLRRQDKLSN